jgi:oxalate decarboxylase/phosphoglucose isomerase-like protein (cupin superfamily)
MKEKTSSKEEIQGQIPIVINISEIQQKRDLSPIMGADVQNFPGLLTKIAYLGICYEPVNGGTTWHTHPLNFGPEISCQEDIWYVLRGKGTMYYKRSGELKSFEFKQGDIVHSKHLTNYTWNTGDELLVIPFFEIPHLPFDENAYGNLRTLTPADIPEEARPLDPPILVHEDDIDLVYPFREGKAAIQPLITPKTADSKHGNVGKFIAEPGQGSDWHTHPTDVWKGFPEEDLSYVIKGAGTLYYRFNGKEYAMPLRQGDMVFTCHLPHCVRNTGTEQLIMLCLLTPNNRAIAGEIPEICP